MKLILLPTLYGIPLITSREQAICYLLQVHDVVSVHYRRARNAKHFRTREDARA